MPRIRAGKGTKGMNTRSGAIVEFRPGAELAGTISLAEGAVFSIKMGGDLSALGLKAGDRLTLTYADWSPVEAVATAAKTTDTAIANAVPSAFPSGVVNESLFPYYSQRDAKGHGEAFRMCNSSSNAMIASYLFAVTKQTNPLLAVAQRDNIGVDDVFLLDYVHQFGDSTDHDAMGRALRKLGIESVFRCDLSVDVLKRSLSLGLPMALGVLHHGNVAAPSGDGHMIAAVKMRGNDDVICYDPFGEGFSYTKTNGKAVVYPLSPTLVGRWLVGNPSGGWGRVFTKVGSVTLPKVL